MTNRTNNPVAGIKCRCLIFVESRTPSNLWALRLPNIFNGMMGQFQNLSQVSRLDKSSFPNPDYVFLFYFIFLPNQIISTELSQHNNVEKWKFQHVCVQQMYTANIYYGWLLSCFDMFEIVWTVSRGDNLTMLHLNDYKSLVVVHLTRTNQTCTFF